MRKKNFDHTSFIVGEVYDWKELRDSRFMLRELKDCYPKTSTPELLELIANAKKSKRAERQTAKGTLLIYCKGE